MTVEITDGNAHLTIEFLKRLYFVDDYWDGNWIGVTVNARLPGFQAAFNAEVNLSEWESFYQGLQLLYSELKGTVRFHAMEDFLAIEVEMYRLGHLHWKVEMTHPVDSENRASLTFAMHSDQSYLPAIHAQIEAVREEFSIKEKQ